MNQNIFCNRKDGATINGKFHPLPRTSEFLADKLNRRSEKQERKAHRKAKLRASRIRL